MAEKKPQKKAGKPAANFIRHIIAADLERGKNDGRVHTRFPPEPNGYLHIGHAKSICLNFTLAAENNGKCNLRFDDTNPEKEDVEYIDAIKRDIEWLGFDWGEIEFYASDYYEKLYDFAVHLIKDGKAYICGLDAEEMRKYRGTLTESGKESPDRNRSMDENLDLFAKMKAGDFEDGKFTLRAKIDMASPNINLRDPTIYRIKRAHHPRTGDDWKIYPMYDFAHGISDALEGVTHSICTLEFEDHRPLYDWYLNNVPAPSHPQQIEFSRLGLNYTVMSKRKLIQLVKDGHVSGWDDPRMPTLLGLKRRGFTPASIRKFCSDLGASKKNSVIDYGILENTLRNDLNDISARGMAILKPLKVVITNFPEGGVDDAEAPVHPHDESRGKRKIPFEKEIYIEATDFMEDPPPKFFRLGPGREVRLRYAYVITCDEVIKDESGNVIELRCSYIPETRSGTGTDKRKVKGVIHWLPVSKALKAEIRLYDRLFSEEAPDAGGKDFLKSLNTDSLETIEGFVEPSLGNAKAEEHFQFERTGFFVADVKDHSADRLVFNRTVTLRDTWAKVKQK